jgi:PKD repeat protein
MDLAWIQGVRPAGTARTARRLLWLAAALTVLAAAAAHPAFAAATIRVSVSTGGGQADDVSYTPAVSADGRFVAFASLASDLVPGDDNDASDVFVYSNVTGETERVSVTSGGAEANGESTLPAISADGRYVAFVSVATNLVSGDGNGVADVFVHDRQTGNTTRASVATGGGEVNGASTSPSISAGGRYVAFASVASDLVSGDTNGVADVFVRDRINGHTERVSVTSDGAQSSGDIGGVAISGDGRYVAFCSTASDLVDGDTNGVSDIFLHDRQAGETTRISVASNEAQADGASTSPSISETGRFVAFASEATNLVDGDTNAVTDVFVRDTTSGTTERVSLTSTGAQVTVACVDPSLSSDGRYVCFSSAMNGLVAGDISGWVDVFVHDRQMTRTERVSIAPNGASGDADSGRSSISTRGRYVAFESSATNLVAGDTNLVQDIFLCERPVADFEADVTNGLLPLTVTFTDLSTGDPTSWVWDFGDGSGATDQNPSHVYELEGYYTITLTVASVYGSDTMIRPEYLHVSSPVPHANFSGTPREGTAPLIVTFTDLSTNSPTSWYWVFDDGDTSTEQNPVHTYDSDGTYSVTLVANNGWGSDIETKDDYIVVGPVAPIADFSGTPTSGTTPLTVAFTDLSINAPTSWAWVFGDGGTSTGQHPTHQYNAAGLFTVSLTAGNSAGADTETKPDYISVALPPPLIADFTATPRIGFAPLNVTFDDASTNSPIAWAWEFGDGATATVQDPAHQYLDEGTYTVTLTATNAEGTDAETKAHYILVTFPDVPFEPEEHWALHSILACVDAGIVQGYPSGLYQPTNPVTRDQMAVYISRALAGGDGNVQVPSGVVEATFTDVLADHWAYRYIEYCAGAEIVQGYPDGAYHPDETVNRGQMAVYVARSVATPTGDAGVPDVPAGTPPTFSDVTADNEWAWCHKYVEYCATADIVQGYWDGTYRPGEAVTRDQMAVYIQRAFELPM